MELNDLYHLIRKEPVSLFIGSGFSLYAGMPSAGNIIEILYDNLSASQQKKINKGDDLRRFTEDYQVLFGRNKLIKILQQHVDVAPKDNHLHELLAKIPFFRAIITTNYDRLIEDSFNDEAAVIVNDTDVFIARQTKSRIYKIHGDIRNPKSIVISSSDYSNQYNRDFKDPFWASVIAEISSRHIIFLGYGYEDENVWADFDHIEKKLKAKNKKRILISPGAKPLKLQKLKQLHIDYVQADGETFINGLIADLKANIVEDHRKGIVDTLTAQEFITAFDMKVDIRSTKTASEVKDIRKVDGPTSKSIHFTTSDQEFIENYKAFTSGYSIRDLKVKTDQLDTFDYLIEGFTFLNKESLSHLNVAHVPKFEGLCNVRFPDQKFLLHKAHCRLFNSIPGNILIEVEVGGFKAEFNIKIKDENIEFNFKIVEPEIPAPINRTYEIIRSFYLLFSGERVEIIPKSGQVVQYRLTAQIHAKKFKVEMELFHAIKKIEKAFNIKFAPVGMSAVSQADKEKIQKLNDLIDHGYYAVKEKEGITIEQMPDSKEVFEEFKKPITPDTYVSMVTRSGRDMELFNKTLHLGAEQVSMKQPTPAELSYEDLRIRLISIDHILVYHYEKFGHWKFIGSRSLWPENDEEN